MGRVGNAQVVTCPVWIGTGRPPEPDQGRQTGAFRSLGAESGGNLPGLFSGLPERSGGTGQGFLGAMRTVVWVERGPLGRDL